MVSKNITSVARFFEVNLKFALKVCLYNDINLISGQWLDINGICKLAKSLELFSDYSMIYKRSGFLKNNDLINNCAKSLGIPVYMTKDGVDYQLFTRDDEEKIINECIRLIESCK